jgi:hypothetical protein
VRIGVTASRHGITSEQATRAEDYLRMFHDDFGATELHHGDCVGGDQRMADLATMVGLRTVAHPPTNDRYRARHGSNEIRRPEPYLDRDRAIVAAVDVLIGLPRTAVEQDRSGTWYTIRRARSSRIGLLVIGPAGALIEAYRPLPVRPPA